MYFNLATTFELNYYSLQFKMSVALVKKIVLKRVSLYIFNTTLIFFSQFYPQ